MPGSTHFGANRVTIPISYTPAHPGGPLLEAAIDNAGSSGVFTIIPAAPQLIVRIYRLWLVIAAATVMQFLDGPQPLDGPFSCETMVLDLDTYPWFTTMAGNPLNMSSSNAVQISGRAYYTQAT